MRLLRPQKGSRKPLMPLSGDRAPIRRSAFSIFMSLMVFGIFLAYKLLAIPRSNGNQERTWILSLVFLGAMFSIIVWIFRRIGWISAQSAEWPDVYVDAYPVQVGKPFRVECTWKSKLSQKFRGASISLILREKAEYGSGTQQRIVFHDNSVMEISVPPDEFRVEGGLAFFREMTLPRSAMHEFSCRHNWIFWILRVKVDIPERPDLQQDFELRMIPPRRVIPPRKR